MRPEAIRRSLSRVRPFRDFSLESLGPASDITTHLFDDVGEQVDVDIVFNEDRGHNVLQVFPADMNRNRYGQVHWDILAESEDTEILALGRGISRDTRFVMGTCLSGDDESLGFNLSGILFGLSFVDSSSRFGVNVDGGFDDNITGLFGSAVGFDTVRDDDHWYFIRAQRSGNEFRGKVWLWTEPEPEEYFVGGIENIPQGGGYGLIADFADGRFAHYLFISAGIDGNPAPNRPIYVHQRRPVLSAKRPQAARLAV